MNRLATWLVAHKDLLDVLLALIGSVSAILLGIMAIVLTRNSNRISQAQLAIAQRELEITEVEGRPHFRVVWRPASDGIDTAELWHDGPDLTSLVVMQYSFLELSRSNEGVKHLPIYYFYERAYTDQPNGHVLTLAARKPPYFRDTFDVTAALASLEQQLQDENIFCTLRVFLSITYESSKGHHGELMIETGKRDGYFGGNFYTRVAPYKTIMQVIPPIIIDDPTTLTAASVKAMLPALEDLSSSLNASEATPNPANAGGRSSYHQR